MVGLITHIYSATQAETTGTTVVGPNEWNSAHALALTVSGNTAGTSSGSGTNIILAATQNLTVSITSNTVYFEGPRLSAWTVGEGVTTTVAATSIGATSGDVFGGLFVLPTEMGCSHIDIFGTISFAFPTLASSSTSHTSSTTGQSWFNLGLWSRQMGTSTGTLTLITSNQVSVAYSLSQSGSSSSQSDTLSMTWMTGVPGASVSGTFTGTTNSTQGTLTAGNTNYFTGNFDMPFACASTLEPGEYFVGVQCVTSGATSNGPTASIYFAREVSAALSPQYFGVSSSTGIGFEYWQGLAMTGGSSASMAASYALSNLTSQSLGQPLAQLVGYGTNTNLL